jgi:hypothetical protein
MDRRYWAREPCGAFGLERRSSALVRREPNLNRSRRLHQDKIDLGQNRGTEIDTQITNFNFLNNPEPGDSSREQFASSSGLVGA